MAGDELGARLADVIGSTGGRARLFERGVVVEGATPVAATFAFPMIGRPAILTGTNFDSNPFNDSLTINPGREGLSFEHVTPVVTDALAGRLALTPTGGGAAVPMSVRSSQGSDPNAFLAGLNIDGALESRRLYDVSALGDDGQWRVVAPHALYYRTDWTDFGLAHITDMHVALRIDTFRATLREAGRHEAADRLINWNDRFRGFVRYANYLHGAGILDVIVATGDLYDYQVESSGAVAGGSNAEFLRNLVLGRAPGPDFAEVEELRVPIFMVPGNHDYRKNPYKLIFDANFAWKDFARVKNFSGYDLPQEDAQILENRLSGVDGSDVQNVDPDTAATMVAVDAANPNHQAFIGALGSYVVNLGKHRVVMIDSSWDVGMVTSISEALQEYFGLLGEDEGTFVGGSPNCEGISASERDLTASVLNEAPADGLVLVALHAPLFNPWHGEYPYFLRETQRGEQEGQVLGFVARHWGRALLPTADLADQVRAAHPTWFNDRRDQRTPRYVKRQDSQDLLDYGVSRGEADTVLKLMAGVGSNRPGDVVLAGHTHRHNEFSIRRVNGDELAFYMDFYTQNPMHYYPTRITTGWEAGPFSNPGIVPKSNVTYVNVAPGAAPDGAPTELREEAKYDYSIEVPPYPNPLSSAADPKAWWAEHRPLVLQTGALGPLENSTASFTGFRLLRIQGDVINKIHFIPTRRLEAHGYVLPWEVAVAVEEPPTPEPAQPAVSPGGRLLFYRDATQNGTGEVANPSVIGLGGWQVYQRLFSGGNGIIYAVDGDGRLLFYRDANQNGTGDVGNPAVIGQGGWQGFQHLFGGGDGIIYAVDGDGRLLFYRDATQDGTGEVANPAVIGHGGWQGFLRLFSGGNGIIYAVDPDGRLLFYRDATRNGTGDVSNPGVIGQGGWQSFLHLFSGGNGTIYAIDTAGRLLFYRDANQDGTGEVSNPSVIGQGGWQNFQHVFSGGNGILYAVDRVGPDFTGGGGQGGGQAGGTRRIPIRRELRGINVGRPGS